MNLLFTMSLLVSVIFAVESSYYWREYDGVVPDDAVPGGTDAAGKHTFIGQAYVDCHGLLVGQINNGMKCINTCGYYTHRICEYIKILCTDDATKLKWIANDSNTTETGWKLVNGGIQNHRVLSIGREKQDGELVIGKVSTYYNNKKRIYYCKNDCEQSSTEFEILIYVE